jgi:hypothetical protein
MTDSPEDSDDTTDITEAEVAEVGQQIVASCDAERMTKAQEAVQALGLNPGEMIQLGAFSAAFGMALLPQDVRLRRTAMMAIGGMVAKTHDAIAKVLAEAEAAKQVEEGPSGFGVLTGDAYVIRADGTVEH